MMKTEKNKNIFYSIILLSTLIVMILSTTFAYYSLIASQKDEDTILYTGKLEINYIDGIYIKNPTLYPIAKPNFNTTKNVYRNTFKVKSSGTLEQTIKIILNITKNEFEKDSLKYILFNENGKEISTGTILNPSEILIADNLYLAHDETATYTLLIWLDNKEYNQINDIGKTVSGQIKIVSTQLKK